MANHAWTKWPWTPPARVVVEWLAFEASRTGAGFVLWDGDGELDPKDAEPDAWFTVKGGSEEGEGRCVFFVNGEGGLEARHKGVSTEDWWLESFLHSSALRAFGGRALYDEGIGGFIPVVLETGPNWKVERERKGKGRAFELLAALLGSTSDMSLFEPRPGSEGGWPGAEGFGGWLESKGRGSFSDIEREWLLCPFAATGAEPPGWVLDGAGSVGLARALAVSAWAGFGRPEWLAGEDASGVLFGDMAKELLDMEGEVLEEDQTPDTARERADAFRGRLAALEGEVLDREVPSAKARRQRGGGPL